MTSHIRVMRFRRICVAAAVAVPAMSSLGMAGEKPWYRSPRLAVITGFIYEPKSALVPGSGLPVPAYLS